MCKQLKEIKTDVESMYNAFNRDDIDGFLDVAENFIDNGYFEHLIEQAEQAVALRAYADKWSLRLGNVNEFLQHRDVADEWGVDVTTVIMNLVVHLEKQNKRYREALEQIKKEETVTTALPEGQKAYTASGHIARKALEE